jgi:hypothetical protein
MSGRQRADPWFRGPLRTIEEAWKMGPPERVSPSWPAPPGGPTLMTWQEEVFRNTVIRVRWHCGVQPPCPNCRDVLRGGWGPEADLTESPKT